MIPAVFEEFFDILKSLGMIFWKWLVWRKSTAKVLVDFLQRKNYLSICHSNEPVAYIVTICPDSNNARIAFEYIEKKREKNFLSLI